MDDFISRTDAIKAIEELPNAYNGWSDAYDKAYIIGTLEEVPSAQPKQGEWIDRSEGGRILHPWWESYECNQCGCYGSKAWNFCPNCGARMTDSGKPNNCERKE